MLLQTSLDAQIGNVCRLVLKGAGSFPLSVGELVSGYRAFLATRQRGGRQGDEAGCRIVRSPSRVGVLGQMFSATKETGLDDLNQSSAIGVAAANSTGSGPATIERGPAKLRSEAPNHSLLFDVLISEIVVLPSTVANGGSTSDAIGVIWANPSARWEPVDTAEFLVHELTHHCMFIDEICNGHYDYDLVVKRDYWAASAILNRPRPVDKVLHSIVVATEVLLLRQHLFDHPTNPNCHPPSAVIAKQTGEAILGLLNLASHPGAKGILKSRAYEILESARDRLSEINVLTTTQE
ncbi:aKG-HExxH-type peptide beta-hydroxylase [Bordetella trematum]|uniref:aKG-HExxH-type peptide beta-hydroxylase n=1 Tax=Bordetella trematum TaxID=123899 RepID=UPI003AF37605